MKVDQQVKCNFGSMKGKDFIIVAKLKDGSYSCKPVEEDGKYYRYTASHLVIN